MSWARIFRNVLSSWVSYAITAVIGFALTPIVVSSLGELGYGLWTLVLSVTGYFGLLDLGIRSSVSRFLARHLAQNDGERFNKTASSAFFLLLGGGVVGLLATLLVAGLFFDSFHVSPERAAEARLALAITGLSISLILPLGLFSAVLYASERFDVVSGVTIVAELSRAACTVWLLSRGYGLVALAMLALTVSAVQYSAFAIAARRLHRDLRISLRIDGEVARELLGFSVYRFVWIVANQLIFYSDALVIGIYLGAAAITPFAIASSLINYGRQIVFLLLDPLYPSASRLDARGDLHELRRLLIAGTRMALIVALPLCVGFIFLGRQFITLWMGEAHSGSAALLTVLTVAQVAAMPQYVSTLVLAGMAKHRPFAWVALAEGIANVILSCILVQRLGLVGVAWGTVIPSLVTNVIVVPFFTLRALDMSVKDYVVDGWLRPVACVWPVVAMAYGFSLLGQPSWPRFTAQVLAIAAVFGLCSYFLCLYAHQRAAVSARLAALFRPTPAASV